MPPPVLGAAARATADQMAGGLGFVWVKKAGAQSGDVLHFVVPEWIDAWIGVGQDGRGRSVEPGEATTTVTMAPMNYLRLGSGRRAILPKSMSGSPRSRAGCGGRTQRRTVTATRHSHCGSCRIAPLR